MPMFSSYHNGLCYFQAINKTMPDYEKPRWLRDLLRFLPLKSQFVLSGNVRDLQTCEVAPGMITAQSLVNTLTDTLGEAGYARLVVWNPLSGFSVSEGRMVPVEQGDETLQRLGLTPVGNAAPGGIDALTACLERLTALDGPPVALVVDFASRLTVRTESLSAAEHNLFTRALVLAHTASPRPAGEQRRPFFNTVIWVVEKEGDLPDWLLIGNPRIRHVPVSRPDSASRRALSPALLRGVPGSQQASATTLEDAESAFVDGTEGLLLSDMNAIATLARVENVPIGKISDAVRRYKVGVTEDPWLRIDREKIHNAEPTIRKRVKGQTHAVTHMLDLIKRAMTGVGAQRKGNRPRGVAFLAGPTGVGKTELAKTLTSLLFGDESAYIRFDMSEFSSEHSDQRLIGAPPGYVGYDVGGELTNAIRERPFSVVLFDEIEKAHPRILDKFLQILDDGVLTSGRGDRVYFSEALIVLPPTWESSARTNSDNACPTFYPQIVSRRSAARCLPKYKSTSSWCLTVLRFSTESAKTSSFSTSSGKTSRRRFLIRWSAPSSKTSLRKECPSRSTNRRRLHLSTVASVTFQMAAGEYATRSRRT